MEIFTSDSMISESNTSSASDQYNSINLIVKKLGHELEEIRLRSLDNLISKLDSHVISESDLNQHKQLFVKLFELFNYAEFKQHEKVLNLLCKLSNNESAIKNIQDINGLEFLNALKNDLKEENKNLAYKVDEIIENLLRGPTNLSNNISTGGLIYEKSSSSLMSTLSNNLTSRPLSPRQVQSDIQQSILSSRSAHSASSSSSSTKAKSTLSLTASSSSASTSTSSSSNNINSLITSDFNLDQFKQQNNLVDFTSSSSLSYKQLTSYDNNNLTTRTNTSESTLTNNNNHNNNDTITNEINFFNTSNNTKQILKSTSVSSLLDINNDGSSTNRTNKSSFTQSHSLRNEFEGLNLDSNRFGSSTSSSSRHYFSNNTINNTTNSIKFKQSVTASSNELSDMSNSECFMINDKIDANTTTSYVISDDTTFYWLPLTFMDRQFLQTAENSLKSNDSKKIKSYCTFLQTIVFNDFPAEIFLQRSSILRILIDLIIKSTNSSSENDDYSLIKCLISCFHYYCIKLKKRIDYVKDPATFSDKDYYSNDLNYLSKKLYSKLKNLNNFSQQKNKNFKENVNLNTSLYSVDTNSLLSSIKSNSFNTNKLKKKSANLNLNKNQHQPKKTVTEANNDNDGQYFPEIDETLNQDLQTSMETVLSETNVENYETDIDEKNLIRKNQEWPIHSFCFKLIDTLIDNLSLIIIKNNKNILNNNFNYQLQTSLIPIICETINNLIDILYDTRHEWETQINLNEILISLFQKLDHNLKYVSNRTLDSSQHSNKYLNMFNRIMYTYFVITLFKIIQLMQSINEINLMIPTDLSQIIFYILNDICLVDSFNNFNSFFSSLLMHLDKPLYEIYSLSNEICESMKSACDFLLKHNQLDRKDDLIKLAKKSLNYMDYHICKDLPRTIVEFCSIITNLEKDDSYTKSNIEYLVTSCMISKSEEIRIETYSAISKIVNDSINVQIATEINSKRYKQINFLLLNKIFYQLIAFGLFDKCLQVKKFCENILSHLLQCELLVPESFRLKLTQLIIIYMPFIQCFASQTDPLGQCILRMSDDHLTPLNSNKSSSLMGSGRSMDESLKLFLTPAVERLRCSLRYLFSKDKSLRKKGYLQTIGFLTKYNSAHLNNDDFNEDESEHQTNRDFDYKSDQMISQQVFNLNDFYLRFIPDKFCDIAIKLKHRNKTFLSNELTVANNPHSVSIFQTDNLLRIYNIFTSDSVDYEVKQNAGEQLAIMMSTGDSRLHKAFINLDGINHCIRLLRKTLLYKDNKKKHLFLSGVEKETLNKIQSSCLTCLSHVLYYNKDLRLIYLFDVDFYRLIFKSLLLSFSIQLKQSELTESIDKSNNQFDHVLYSIASCIQEDASIILFTLLYNQVSSLDYYYEYESTQQPNNNLIKFDLNLNLKENLLVPFNTNSTSNNGLVVNNELKQIEKQQWQAYEFNYKLNSILSSKLGEDKLNINDSNKQSIVQLLDKKFRLYWNFKWHGGSLKKICHELILNEKMVLNKIYANFNPELCLNECDKCEIKYTDPFFLFKQLSTNINTCTTHQEALSSLDLIQILTTICDETKFKFGIEFQSESDDDEYDIEFNKRNSLSFYFNRHKCDWHLSLNRFTSILPSNKSRLDQLLYSNSFQTISKLLSLQMKMYDSYNNKNNDNNKQLALITQDGFDKNELENLSSMMFLDKWLYNMIYNSNSSLLLMIKQFLITYESDETRINSYIFPLCEFLKIYFDRLCSLTQVISIDFLLPPIELLKICIEQIQACEIEKFRNLNKLAILINLIGSLLRVCLFNKSNEHSFFLNNSEELNISLNNAFFNNNNKILIQLIKSLVQIINTFNIGRGGLSLSFMGNFITKSAHISLLQLIKNSISSDMEKNNNAEIVKAVICLKDQKSNLQGSSWLIPLMLHREPQIRSISFSLISVLINVPLAKSKLLANKNGIWSIALNVLLNRNECSIVRIQACAFLINLTQSMIAINNSDNLDETNISMTNLQYLLHEFNFFQQIAYILSTFYPFETYSFTEIKQKSVKKNDDPNDDISICSPLLVSSICQLLYNLNILLKEEALVMINKHNIINLLSSYVKPVNLLTKNKKSLNNSDVAESKLNENLIEMLQYILIYFNLCCQMDQNFIVALMKTQSNHKNMVYDLVESLSLNPINKDKLRPFFSVLFELLSTFLNNYDDKVIVENCLIIISRSWLVISEFILNEILIDCDKLDNLENIVVKSTMDIYQSQLFENSLKFYSIYLSKLALLSNESENIQTLNDNIAYLFDFIEEKNSQEDKSAQDYSTKTIGGKLCKKLIKQFDKYFLVNNNQNFKLIISNVLKGLFAISDSAKNVAVDSGLIETLVEHLKYTHSKLNLKSLSTKGALKDNTFINDLQQTLLILKYLMCNNPEIKESITKSNLISIIHSFWCWAIQDQNLLKASLSTLCTLTANNKLAISLMAQSNISAQTTSNTINSNLTGLSLLYSIIKTVQKLSTNTGNQNAINNINQSKSSFIILKYAFSLLTNCAQSNECKNIIWKSNFLHDFVSMDNYATKSLLAKTNFKKEKLWLNFLLSLSFSQDGQQFFMKVDSLLSLIIKFLDTFIYVQNAPQQPNNQQIEVQYLSLLILRNLAFNQANKSKLVSNADYVNTIIQTLKSKDEKFQLVALSAIDSLIFDFQKAKVIFKNGNVLRYLVELGEFHHNLKVKNNNSNSIRILSIINNLIKILNE